MHFYIFSLHYNLSQNHEPEFYSIYVDIKRMIQDNQINLRIIRDLEDWPYTTYNFVQFCRFETNYPMNQITVIQSMNSKMILAE